MPAIRTPIDCNRRLARFISVIDVAASVSGEVENLSPRRDPPQVPLHASEGALCILTVDPENGEAVRLDLNVATRDLAEAETCVDGRKSERDFLLPVIDP